MSFRVFEILRAAKWTVYPLAARARAALPAGRLRNPVTFVLGCGRSGTTALGQALSQHRGVRYLNEPIHYWHTIDSRTDHIDFFGSKGQCFFDAADATPLARTRFARLFGQAESLSGGKMIVEKLPANPLRVHWINELSPNSRFVHIVRDGRFVCRSIDELCRLNQYRVMGKSGVHQWWGRHFHKWTAFESECVSRGLCVESFATISAPAPHAFPAMAALEWLVKVRQVRAAAAALGLGPDRFIEIRYEDLVLNPAVSLEQIEQLMGLSHDPRMIDTACKVLEPRKWGTPDVPLPAPLYQEFVYEMERLGYPTTGVRVLSDVANAAG